MLAFPRLSVLALVLAAACFAQADLETPETFLPAGDHPRLLLTASRVKRLKRERERQALQWEPFRLLLTGKASLPEPGFASALYSQVTGDAQASRRAVDWALAGRADLRQTALVFDWCQAALAPAETARIAARLESALQRPPGNGVAETRDRALAAIAIADNSPKLAEHELERIVRNWWRGGVARELAAGRPAVSLADSYPLLELLHAVRDNLNIDLRESAREYFLRLPLAFLLGCYPAIYPASENDYRIPVTAGAVDLNAAVLARAASLALAAYDPNALESQYLQGWLMHDRFQMRGAYGAPYEFLWANPYQPGLSYYSAPTQVRLNGQLFLRAGWDDDAPWLAWSGGRLQKFEAGEPRTLSLEPGSVRWAGDTAVIVGPAGFARLDQPARTVFLIALKPSAFTQVEIENREMREDRADAGGVLSYDFDPLFQGGIAFRPAPHR